jgi:predicted DCC family thiol-disulfide oxidoreductase YuxK
MHSTTGLVGQITDPLRRRPPAAGDDEGMTSPPTDAPVFLYDGDCGFCSASARVIESRILRTDRPNRPRVLPWQRADLAGLGLTAAECELAVQWVDRGTGVRVARTGPAAIAAVLGAGGPGWRLAGRVLRMPPVTALAWPIYRLIARHRDRMPGGTAACALPQADRPLANR